MRKLTALEPTGKANKFKVSTVRESAFGDSGITVTCERSNHTLF